MVTVQSDAELYCNAVQAMPFARPHFDEQIAALDFAMSKNHPGRGEYHGALSQQSIS
ncbi:hypothetical protein [Hydrogenophaga borbori]|uniref:hypothetical protein n=1 Tax=Hydrogenophaga borbori TaxID=2294117 RepID=UPI00301E0472